MNRKIIIVLDYDSNVELIIHESSKEIYPSRIIMTMGESTRIYEPKAEKHPQVKTTKNIESIIVVFDQMFHGFAGIIQRELPKVRTVEILGRGIDKPVEREDKVILWPARDDYDVVKAVEYLSEKYDLVILFTGDKKLARQARLVLRDKNVIIEYMPPSEYPGKEALAREMIAKIINIIYY